MTTSDAHVRLSRRLCEANKRIKLENPWPLETPWCDTKIQPSLMVFGRLSYMLARPVLPIVCALVMYRSKRATSIRSCVALGIFAKCVYELFTDKCSAASGSYRVKSGLKIRQQNENGEETPVWQILKRCAFAQTAYKPPLFLCTGDLTTVFSTATYCPPKVRPVLHRIFHPVQNKEEYFALDFAYPEDVYNAESSMVLLVPGIGGGSDSPYVTELMFALHNAGYATCVLVARGLADSFVFELSNIFNPAETDDIDAALHSLGRCFKHVHAIGFSLGGVQLCNYVANRAPSSAPPNFSSVLSISGAFKTTFANWSRYKEVYQPLIVPTLVSELLTKYLGELRKIVPESTIAALQGGEVRTYRQLHKTVFRHIGWAGSTSGATAAAAAAQPCMDDADNADVMWNEWVASTESLANLGRVRTPTLLMSAIDDPFHSADLIGVCGIERLLEQTDAGANVAVLMTPAGGHVAWPESGNESGGYSFMRRVATQYVTAVEAAACELAAASSS
jgi:predicted alpha/beta-fold hydrolase